MRIKGFLLYLVILLLFESPIFAGQKTKTISEEVGLVNEEVCRLDSANEQDKQQIENLLKYLQVLEQKRKESCPDDEDTMKISGNFKNNIMSILKRLDEAKHSNVTAVSVYELFEYIKNNKNKWKNDLATMDSQPEEFISKDGTLNVAFHLEDNKQKHHYDLYINLMDKPIGEGAFKTLIRLVQYKTWENVAAALIKDPENIEKLDAFRQEGSILEMIRNLPESKKRGLVDTVYFSDKKQVPVLIQVMYDMNLLEFFETQQFKDLPYGDRLEAVSQLTDGLTTFHELGYVHHDIKPENILYRTIHSDGKEKLELVYTDFDVSNEVKAMIQGKRPIRGNEPYMSPEVAKGEWSGSDEKKGSTSEKEDLTFRSDVLPHALVMYQLLFGEQHMAIYDSLNYGDIQSRRNQLLGLYVQRHNSRPDYTAEDHLFTQAFQLDPKKRLRMLEFQKGINHLKWKLNHSNDSIEVTASNRRSLQEEIDKLKIKPVQNEDLDQLFKGKPNRSYLLRPSLSHTSSAPRVELIYKDNDGEIKKKLLDVTLDLKKTEQLKAEIKFLQDIGTIDPQLHVAN